MRRTTKLTAIVMALSLLAASCGDDDDDEGSLSTDEESVESASFTAPDDGATVARRFTIAMAATGVEIEPAGEMRDGAGHFHVMVDAACLDPGETVPNDDQHIHFGKGQTEGQLFLEPGEHELCLQVADGTHMALPVIDEITVTVDGDEPYVSLGVPDGDSVASPVSITMEASGVEIEPAGEVREGAGHFHVIVDGDCVAAGEAIPKDATHLHFGDGSTSADLELAPGEHTMCLQVGDGAHTALPSTHRVVVVVA